MLKRLTLSLGLALALLSGTALAADPSAHQIYLALQGGNVAQAQQMIQQVLHDHPESAKAHFVAAEIDARAGNYGLARQQLARAESLRPGLTFESPRAVSELRRQLGEAPGGALTRSAAPRHGTHLGWALLLIGGVVVVWMIVRRRMAGGYNAYPGQVPGPGQYPGGVPPGGMAGGPPGYGPGGYPPGYGGGSGIMRNIGTGLAIGAGMAAGEELVGHMFGGNTAGSAAGGVIPDANAGQAVDPQVNGDMGGNDFGMSDPGSWDDGGGGGGWDGGGDDGGGGWT